MRNNNKYILIMILILGIVFIPFNVIAVEGDEELQPPTNTENTEPVDPGTNGDTSADEDQNTDLNNPPTTDPGTTTTPDSEPTTTPDDNTSNEEDSDDTTSTDDKKEEEKEEPKEETEDKKKEEKEDKKPTNNYTNYNPSTTVVDNAKKRVEISIVSEKDNTLLSGIKFRIQDKKGNIFYEEETTSEVFVFEEMELGTYYLVQVNTLDGYKENNDKIKFVVSEESEIVKVEVVNKVKEAKKSEKKRPELFTGTALLSTVAMFDVALGIGIIVYVRKAKNKIKNKK